MENNNQEEEQVIILSTTAVAAATMAAHTALSSISNNKTKQKNKKQKQKHHRRRYIRPVSTPIRRRRIRILRCRHYHHDNDYEDHPPRGRTRYRQGGAVLTWSQSSRTL